VSQNEFADREIADKLTMYAFLYCSNLLGKTRVSHVFIKMQFSFK